MRILLISKEGDGLGVAQRLAFEGNEVDVYIAESRFAKAGRGLVNRIPSWPQAAKKADLLLTDCVGLGRLEPKLRSLGTPLLGCSELLDKIELDRGAGMDMFQRAGVAIPETVRFSSTREADRIVKGQDWGPGWVIKPNGNISTAKTMIVKDQTSWDRCLGQLSPDSSGILQRVLSGIEVSTEGWFNGTRWLTPFNHTFEEKRFLAGGLGVNTGCMGNVVVASASNKLTKATVEPLAPLLKMIDYHGPFDVNCIVTQDSAYALEATSRMGYDAVEALIEGLEEPASLFLYDVARGANRNMKLTSDTMIAVRLSIPPWPARKPDSGSAGEPVEGIDDAALNHLFLTDLYKTEMGYFTAGGDGVLLKATAIGRVRPGDERQKPDYTYEARRRVYRTLDRISVSGKQYRIDIGDRVNREMAQLREWGWL